MIRSIMVILPLENRHTSNLGWMRSGLCFLAILPHKKGRLVTEGKEREDMVKLAIASVPYFVYSDFELKGKEILIQPRR